MKEGWEYKKLGEVCEIYQPQTIASCLLKEEGKYPVFGANGMIGRYDSYNHKDPEVLLCCRGATCGAINVSFPFSWINGNAMVVKPINDSYLKTFLRYLLLTLDYSHIITGAAQPQITRKSIGPVIVPVPLLSEQQSIVDYLDSAFAKIDAMKTNAEKALNEAKALFQASLKEMLEPKEGWEENTLGDICEIKSILVDPTEVQYKNLLHVGGANIVSETGELIDLKTAAEEELTSGKFTFNDKDVLYNKIRPYLIKVSRPDFSGLCSADMYPLTSKKGMTRDYLYYILVSRDFTDYAIMNSARAGMPKLNRQSLFAYKCMIPSLSEQQSIVAILDSLKSKVDRLQENYDKISRECDALKQAILRQVFE